MWHTITEDDMDNWQVSLLGDIGGESLDLGHRLEDGAVFGVVPFCTRVATLRLYDEEWLNEF